MKKLLEKILFFWDCYVHWHRADIPMTWYSHIVALSALFSNNSSLFQMWDYTFCRKRWHLYVVRDGGIFRRKRWKPFFFFFFKRWMLIQNTETLAWWWYDNTTSTPYVHLCEARKSTPGRPINKLDQIW